jgi:TetR/AcrR family transcriptional repressor of mexJK operon
MAQEMALQQPAEQRRKGRPKLEEAAAIERAIRDAALAVLLEHGEAATLNAVAQAAGISRKSLYARYSSRSDLFIEVIREAMHHAQGLVFDDAGPIDQDLFAYIRRMLDVVVSPRSVAIQRLLAVDPAYIRALKPEMRASSDRHFVQPLQGLLLAACARGEIASAGIPAIARAIVLLIFAEGHGMDPDQVATRSVTWQDDYARFLTDLMCQGLLPRTSG